MTSLEEIKMINKIIACAIDHGGDAGGAYFSDRWSLTDAINDWLTTKDYHEEYVVCSRKYDGRRTRESMEYWSPVSSHDGGDWIMIIPKDLLNDKSQVLNKDIEGLGYPW